MRTVTDTIGGLWALLRLGVCTRFQFRGPYWKWRLDTAFGTDPAHRPPRRQMVRATLDYGRWVHRMRRFR